MQGSKFVASSGVHITGISASPIFAGQSHPNPPSFPFGSRRSKPSAPVWSSPPGWNPGQGTKLSKPEVVGSKPGFDTMVGNTPGRALTCRRAVLSHGTHTPQHPLPPVGAIVQPPFPPPPKKHKSPRSHLPSTIPGGALGTEGGAHLHRRSSALFGAYLCLTAQGLGSRRLGAACAQWTGLSRALRPLKSRVAVRGIVCVVRVDHHSTKRHAERTPKHNFLSDIGQPPETARPKARLGGSHDTVRVRNSWSSPPRLHRKTWYQHVALCFCQTFCRALASIKPARLSSQWQ